jgi:hypothetical protein
MMIRLLLAVVLLAVSVPSASAGCFLFLCSRGLHVVSHHRYFAHRRRRARVITVYRVIVEKPAPRLKHIYW